MIYIIDGCILSLASSLSMHTVWWADSSVNTFNLRDVCSLQERGKRHGTQLQEFSWVSNSTTKPGNPKAAKWSLGYSIHSKGPSTDNLTAFGSQDLFWNLILKTCLLLSSMSLTPLLHGLPHANMQWSDIQFRYQFLARFLVPGNQILVWL